MKNEKINYNQKVNNDCVEIIPFTLLSTKNGRG